MHAAPVSKMTKEVSEDKLFVPVAAAEWNYRALNKCLQNYPSRSGQTSYSSNKYHQTYYKELSIGAEETSAYPAPSQ